MSQQDKREEFEDILSFLNAPEDEYVIAIDCSDCDSLAALAEQVAAGTPVDEVLPALSEHIQYWRDCREEFYALVAVLKAEDDGKIASALDQIEQALDQHRDDNPSDNSD